MKKYYKIPYSTQTISKKDISSVTSALKSEMLTQGPLVKKFEGQICQKVDATYAISFNSATSALHSACLALGLGKGDIAWVPAISFVASANCAIYCGASVDFLDISYNTFNICTELLEQKLIQAKKTNSLPKVVLVVHMAGASADMKKIYSLSSIYGFFILEDASHALGATYENTKVGSCKYSNIAVFSFHPVKTITSGEGGIATTNDALLHEKMMLLRSHGITRDIDKMLFEPEGSWYYEQISLGYNYRMNDLEAALGISQLEQLEHFNTKRQKIAFRYKKLLGNELVDLPIYDHDNLSSWHLYIIRLKSSSKIKRKEVFESLRSFGIGVNVHYIPIYRHPFYKKKLPKGFSLLNSEEYYRNALSIPLYPKLKKNEQNFVIEKLKDLLK